MSLTPPVDAGGVTQHHAPLVVVLRSAKVRRVARPSAWTSVGQDVLWRVASRPPEPPELSWPLAPETARMVRLRWPRQQANSDVAPLLDTLLQAFRGLVDVEIADVPQPRGNILVFDFAVDGAALRVGIDYEDRPVLHESVDELPLLIKLQHRRGGYGRDNVVPGGFLTVARDLYALYPRYRALRARSTPRYDVYGRFSLNFAPETRRRAVEALNAQQAFGYEGGLKPVLWAEYLREACRARLCLDLPGRGPFCFRLVEYLALGCPIIGPRHEAEMHVPLVAGEHVAYANEDLSDLVEVAQRYLDDDAARRRLGENAAHYFDRYLHPRQLAAYYLDRCLATARRQSGPNMSRSG